MKFSFRAEPTRGDVRQLLWCVLFCSNHNTRSQLSCVAHKTTRATGTLELVWTRVLSASRFAVSLPGMTNKQLLLAFPGNLLIQDQLTLAFCTASPGKWGLRRV